MKTRPPVTSTVAASSEPDASLTMAAAEVPTAQSAARTVPVTASLSLTLTSPSSSIAARSRLGGTVSITIAVAGSGTAFAAAEASTIEASLAASLTGEPSTVASPSTSSVSVTSSETSRAPYPKAPDLSDGGSVSVAVLMGRSYVTAEAATVSGSPSLSVPLADQSPATGSVLPEASETASLNVAITVACGPYSPSHLAAISGGAMSVAWTPVVSAASSTELTASLEALARG